MATQQLQTLAYRLIRYTPSLIRDEWLNLGVLLVDPAGKRARVRLIEEPEEYARVRRWLKGQEPRYVVEQKIDA